jgi:transposase
MTEKKRRRGRYTDEFKSDAVRLVLDEKLPVARVARDLGVHQNTLHGWVNKVRSEQAGVNGEDLSDDEREELKRLRREIRILREEREILKKAAAFFAKESR